MRGHFPHVVEFYHLFGALGLDDLVDLVKVLPPQRDGAFEARDFIGTPSS